MSQNYIYCYSGSGNCLDIAKNIAKQLGDTDIIMMRKKPVICDVSGAKTVGFVFPCYAGGLPGDVEKFVADIIVDRDAYTYGVVSYSGYKGIGLSVINKYVPLDYWDGISHNCSCIWLFPHNLMMPFMSTKKAQLRSEKLANEIGQKVRDRVKKDGKIPSNPVNALEAKLWPKLSLKKTAQMSVNASRCTGCGQCENICPRGNVQLKGKLPAFGMNCIGCLSCLQYCPVQAIDIGSASIKRERYHNPNVSAGELTKDIIHIG